MDSADASHDSFEEARDQVLDLLDLAHFEYLLELRQEERLLDTVGEWPVFEQTFEERDGERAVLRQEEHRASEQLLVELRARLHLVEGNDNVLEEDHVLVSQGDSETGDDTRENIEKLSGAVEFMGFMNKTEEALVNSFSNHFTAGHQLNTINRIKL